MSVNFIDDIPFGKPFRTYVDKDADSNLIVSIDCGHGGIHNGKYQTQGKQYDHGDFVFYEGVFNRQIGKALALKFWNEHISYTFTTISNTDEPLSGRIEYLSRFMKQYPKNQHLLLSIHGNAAGVESASGFEYFSTIGVTDSDYAADLYFPHMRDIGLKMRIQKMEALQYDKESGFFIIRKAEGLGAMALLLECGFFTNREEAQKMLDPEWQKILVNSLYKGTKDVIHKIKTDGTIRPT